MRGAWAAVYGGVQLVSSIYKGCESWTQMIPHESSHVQLCTLSVRLSVCLSAHLFMH